MGFILWWGVCFFSFPSAFPALALTTATITQFAQSDEESGGRIVDEGSGHCNGAKVGSDNVKQCFVQRMVVENSSDKIKLDETAGFKKRRKGCPSDGLQTQSLFTSSYGLVDLDNPKSGLVDSDNLKPGTQEDLTKVCQEERKRKATKLDNAEVLKVPVS
jgi:hypothetical protein